MFTHSPIIHQPLPNSERLWTNWKRSYFLEASRLNVGWISAPKLVIDLTSLHTTNIVQCYSAAIGFETPAIFALHQREGEIYI